MNTAHYRVHKMVQDLMRNASAQAAFAADPETTFAAYELAETEKQLLRDASPPALHELGMHPNLQMKYLRLRIPPGSPPGGGPLDAYLKTLTET